MKYLRLGGFEFFTNEQDLPIDDLVAIELEGTSGRAIFRDPPTGVSATVARGIPGTVVIKAVSESGDVQTVCRLIGFRMSLMSDRFNCDKVERP